MNHRVFGRKLDGIRLEEVQAFTTAILGRPRPESELPPGLRATKSIVEASETHPNTRAARRRAARRQHKAEPRRSS